MTSEHNGQPAILLPFSSLLPILETPATSRSSKISVRIINLTSDAAVISPAPKQLDFVHPNPNYVTGSMNGWNLTHLPRYPSIWSMFNPQTLPALP